MFNRKHTRRDLLKTSAAAGLGAAALSQSSSFAAPATHGVSRTAPQDLEPAELTFYFGANPEEEKTRQTIIDAFQEKFPQITIKPQVAEGDVVQELQIQFAGGAGPDILMGWELSYAGLADRNIFADLNEFIDNDPEYQEVLANDHTPELVNMFKYNDAQYVLPEQFAGVVLFYNKGLFEEAGIEPPPADWTDSSWTFDKFLETAQALTKEDGGRVSQFGFTDAWWPPLSAFVLATSNGGNWFDQYVAPTASTVTDPKVIEAVQWYADLANVHHVMPNAEEVATQAGPDMFMGGRAAMALVGHWMYPAFSSVDGLDFDIGVLPVGPGGTTPKTDLGSTGLGISATTQFPQHAWEFVKFSTGPEGQKLIAESGLFVPVLKSVAESDSYKNAHPAIENAHVFTDGLQNAVELPISPKWNEISAVWVRETDKVLLGQEQAADVFPPLEEEINKILGS